MENLHCGDITLRFLCLRRVNSSSIARTNKSETPAGASLLLYGYSTTTFSPSEIISFAATWGLWYLVLFSGRPIRRVMMLSSFS